MVPEDGAPVGTYEQARLSLEGDVTDMAHVVMEEGGGPRLHPGLGPHRGRRRDLGLGLGCNSAIEVFIEPAEKAAEVTGALPLRPRGGAPE